MIGHLYDALAFAVALAATVLGFLALVEEHRASPQLQRIAVAVLVFLSVDVLLDAAAALESDTRTADLPGVAMVAALAGVWWFRLVDLRARRALEKLVAQKCEVAHD